MSRITERFNRNSKNILNIYCTAGFPQLESTLEIMLALQDGGADIIELGIPYSDPLADGPVIQASGSKALKNGMSISVLLEQLRTMREKIHIPVVLMGYINPILQYGFQRFCTDFAAVGVDGLIIPDLPLYEYREKYKEMLQSSGIDFIFLVTPETTTERIYELDQESAGFLYAVSSSSTTGGNISESGNEQYFERLAALRLKNPVLIGFGVRDKSSFNMASAYVNGAIIGTAFIKRLERSADIRQEALDFLGEIRSK